MDKWCTGGDVRRKNCSAEVCVQERTGLGGNAESPSRRIKLHVGYGASGTNRVKGPNAKSLVGSTRTRLRISSTDRIGLVFLSCLFSQPDFGQLCSILAATVIPVVHLPPRLVLYIQHPTPPNLLDAQSVSIRAHANAYPGSVRAPHNILTSPDRPLRLATQS